VSFAVDCDPARCRCEWGQYSGDPGVRFLIELERGKPTAQLAKTLAVLDALDCCLEITTPAESSGSGA
jgi:hypothetical protein